MDRQATQFQSGDQSREPADSPLRDSPLINRLAQRGAAPIGLIDTHHPRHLHARASGWMAERFGWMEHLRTRHLGEGAGPAPQASLGDGARGRLLNGVGESQGDGPLIARKVAPVDAQQGSSPPAIVPPAADSSSSLARVSRRGPQTPSDAPIVQRKVKADEVRLSGDGRPTPRPTMTGVEVPIAEKTPVLSSSSRPPITPALNDSPAASMRETPQPQMKSTGRTAANPVSAAPQLAPLPPAKGGATPTAQRKVDARPRGIETPSAHPSPLSPSAADSVIGRTGSVRGEEMMRATAALTRPGLTAITGASKGEVVAGSAPPPAQLIQRRLADHRAGQPTPVLVQSPAPLAPGGGAHELPQMIWRKVDAGEQSRTLTGHSPLVREPAAPMIARQIDGGSAAFESGATVGETTTTGTATSAQGPGLNLAHLAEQVGRVLTRQLEAERERRGMKR